MWLTLLFNFSFCSSPGLSTLLRLVSLVILVVPSLCIKCVHNSLSSAGKLFALCPTIFQLGFQSLFVLFFFLPELLSFVPFFWIYYYRILTKHSISFVSLRWIHISKLQQRDFFFVPLEFASQPKKSIDVTSFNIAALSVTVPKHVLMDIFLFPSWTLQAVWCSSSNQLLPYSGLFIKLQNIHLASQITGCQWC